MADGMSFEQLECWQLARQLVRHIYTLAKGEELSKDYGLNRQIQRASVSIMSNVAEGFERRHVAEKLQAYNVARASAAEVRSLLYVIEDNFPLSGGDAKLLREEVISVGKLISGLIRSTEARRSAL